MSDVVIAGGGIAGLLLALSLQKNLGITATVYEQATQFDDEVGGAIGLYPNGLRVIRDVSPKLLKNIRSNAKPYVYRRWVRHDGTEVAIGLEKYLCKFESKKDEAELGSIGMRRWKLQKCLVQACVEANIPIIFGKRVNSVENVNGKVRVSLSDSTQLMVDFVFGCDGVKSAVRNSLFSATDPEYTGVTCLMGSAPIPREEGICFPSSSSSKCHACYYPTGHNEQVFQIYFVTPERPETWRPLSAEEGIKECLDLASVLEKDGWHDKFIEPLRNAKSVIRVGLRAREPIPVWSKGNIVLLGDAAHPPVPYIGQGAMSAIEDVGILVKLLKWACNGGLNEKAFQKAVSIYQRMRLPRTTEMLRQSKALGNMQLSRAVTPSAIQKWKSEMFIKFNVWRHGTLPTMWFGSAYDYNKEVDKEILLNNKAKL